MTRTFSHFTSESVIEQDEKHVVFRLGLEVGEGTAAIYPVMPGVEVVEMTLEAPRFLPVLHQEGDVLEVNHCLEGRAEFQMCDGCLQYIGEGDLFLSALHNHSESIDLPLGHYRGIAILFDAVDSGPELERQLSEIPFHMPTLLARLFSGDECFMIQAKEEVQRIFSGMYTAPEAVRCAYYRLKALELLIYLSCLDPDTEPQKPVYARQQVEIIKAVHKRMTEEYGRRFTIEELARRSGISATVLKSGFKDVYGVSIGAYMKQYRIERAAELLRNTTLSVADIAAEIGYTSKSKFGAAFKERMKLNPLEYRKKAERKMRGTQQ